MRIARLTAKNFRNLAALDVEFGPNAVIVGENRSGKTNLIHALRLVLDPSLPFAERRLSPEDFWDGLGNGDENYDPIANHDVIEITVDLADFEGDGRVLAVLWGALISQDPPVARLTYRWAPDPNRQGKYRDAVYLGDGDSGNRVPQDLRDELFVAYLPALRDVESDIRSWRKSPLRLLLDGAIASMTDDELVEIKRDLERANSALQGLAAISGLNEMIIQQMRDSVGPRQSLDTSLRSTPQNPRRIVRSMQLYVDGGAARPLGAASLGTQNMLYFALLQLGFAQQTAERLVTHTLILAEEPEAHLHPHVQRSAVGSLATTGDARSLIVTTHSPHVVSAVDAKNLIRLSARPNGTTAHSGQNAGLSSAEWLDMNRYLSATQAEIVFANRVLLVEGFAEEVLIPAMARELGMDLDKLGLSVCAVHGTHFLSFMRFCAALGIRAVVLTDGDPDSSGERVGVGRLETLRADLGLKGNLNDVGLFAGLDTLEVDLYRTGTNAFVVERVLKELGSGRAEARVDGWQGDPSKKELISEIRNAGGKGRFAQRLASESLQLPDYIERALNFLAANE